MKEARPKTFSLTNVSKTKKVEISLKSTLPEDSAYMMLNIDPGQTISVEKEFDGGCAVLTIILGSKNQKYMIPICESPIEIDPENQRVSYNGRELPMFKSGGSKTTQPTPTPQKSNRMTLIFLIFLLLILLYFIF